MAWDPRTYLTYGNERTRPAAELLARIDCEAPRAVADLGCGPGNSTALLATRFPDAEIEGVDNSAEMLAEARKSPFRARWTLADVSAWAPAKPCDVIYSNATYQWIPHHTALLPRLFSYVKPGGTFAFQVPCNFREPSHTLLHETAANGPWAAKLEGVRDGRVLEPEEYFDILEPVAGHIDIWETCYMQTLTGEDAVFRWTIGTALRPFAAALEGAEREAFLAEYRHRLREAYPTRASGITLFPFHRLFCVAKR